MKILRKFWNWLNWEDSNGNLKDFHLGYYLSIGVLGYRVQIYQKDKDMWTFKTTGLYSYPDACKEAEKIRNETGKKTRVLEYWELQKIVKKFD